MWQFFVDHTHVLLESKCKFLFWIQYSSLWFWYIWCGFMYLLGLANVNTKLLLQINCKYWIVQADNCLALSEEAKPWFGATGDGDVVFTEGLHAAAHRRQVRQHQGGAAAAAERRQPRRAGQERLDAAPRRDSLQPRERRAAAARTQGKPPRCGKGQIRLLILIPLVRSDQAINTNTTC